MSASDLRPEQSGPEDDRSWRRVDDSGGEVYVQDIAGGRGW